MILNFIVHMGTVSIVPEDHNTYPAYTNIVAKLRTIDESEGALQDQSSKPTQNALDLLVVKAIVEIDAQAPPMNEKMKKMNKACTFFISLLPVTAREMQQPAEGKGS